MLHLGAYIMMPFMAHSALAAPAPSPNAASGSLIESMFAPAPGKAPAANDNAQLITSLEQAATAVDRLNLIANDAAHVYDL
jgi:hypothetical protein